MSLSPVVLELLAFVVEAVCSATPWPEVCPNCRGDLRWVPWLGRRRRIRCEGCGREWVKDNRGRWEVDAPHNPT